MLSIRLYDFFYGFVRNYWTFGIRYQTSATKFTHMILGYFANLGHMLAFYVNYEAGRTDLTWYYSYEDLEKGDPWLHVEHENSSSRLDRIIEKLQSTSASGFLGICYPASEEDNKDFLKELRKEHKKLTKDKEFLMIVDRCIFHEGENDLMGYYANSKRKDLLEIEATSYKAPDGLYYACWRDEREEDKEG